jgi:hypothetical protein
MVGCSAYLVRSEWYWYIKFHYTMLLFADRIPSRNCIQGFCVCALVHKMTSFHVDVECHIYTLCCAFLQCWSNINFKLAVDVEPTVLQIGRHWFRNKWNTKQMIVYSFAGNLHSQNVSDATIVNYFQKKWIFKAWDLVVPMEVVVFISPKRWWWTLPWWDPLVVQKVLTLR